MITTLLSGLRTALLTSGMALLLSGCELLEFSPNDIWAPKTAQDLTSRNLAQLAAQPKPTGGDTLRFVFTTDSQRYYDELDPLVNSINKQRGVSFVLIGGDISDFGLSREMSWVVEKLNKLNVPYLTVVGNHDLVGNGQAAYQEMFGPLNYSFTYGDTKFICVDTNSREYAFSGQVPNMPWLQQQFADTAGAQRQISMCHVPPFDNDFDPTLVKSYAQTLAQAPRLVFNLSGHVDKFGVREPYDDGVTYINGYNVKQRRYLLLTLWGKEQYKLEAIAY